MRRPGKRPGAGAFVAEEVAPRPALDTLALLIDFGSTFTKITAVDMETARIVGRAQARSTVDRDVCDGLLQALVELHRRHGVFERRPTSLDCLDTVFTRACSSAAGGLRIVVIGNVPGLTVEAGNAAALGAGGKLVRAFGFRLSEQDMAAIVAAKPDLILLAGGADGGDQRTILHNAKALAAAHFLAPIIVAGNAAVAAQARDVLASAGYEATIVANVMPVAGKLAPEAAREEIRRIFAQHITQAKGLDRLAGRVPVILPTPMAVYEAALLGARGLPDQPGLGELMVVDVGGATTDVHSIGEGSPQRPAMIVPTGLPEPFAKRTVEGDLGVRWNAPTVLERVGAKAFAANFHAIFPEIAASDADVLGYVDLVGAKTDTAPSADWQFAVDALLARSAVDIAIDRHVGRRKPFYAREGVIYMQSGKDLTEIPTVIGTGGVFTYNTMAKRIIATRTVDEDDVLRPRDPNIILDAHYALYAIGLLADSHPDVAMRLFIRHFASDGPPPLARGFGAPPCECCSTPASAGPKGFPVPPAHANIDEWGEDMAQAERIKDVERPVPVRFAVGDRSIEAPVGENLACALMAAGIRRLRSSPRAHGDRGAFCLMGVCQECLVRVDGRVTTACTEPVRAGMVVELGERA